MDSNTSHRAADAIRAEFLPAETAVQAAAVRSARLLATVLEQADQAQAPIGAGALMIRKLNSGLSSLIAAREEFALAHKAAASLPRELGMDPAAFGDVSECPPDEYPTRGAANVVPIRA